MLVSVLVGLEERSEDGESEGGEILEGAIARSAVGALDGGESGFDALGLAG